MRSFDRGLVSFVRVGASINRRENPFYELADLRRDVRVEVDRALVGWLRVGANARVANVEFGDDYDAASTAAGVHVTFDTRIDLVPAQCDRREDRLGAAGVLQNATGKAGG